MSGVEWGRWFHRALAGLALGIGILAAGRGEASAAESRPKNIVFLAGTKSHGPGDHEYEKGLRLLAKSLERSPNAPSTRCVVVTDGWPAPGSDDEAALDQADAIVLYCDGSDHDEQAHPILRGDRLKTLDRLMARGVGMALFHYAVFAPKDKAGERFLDWTGGYFDYETGDAPNHWYSKISVHNLRVDPATPAHPISRGLEPFDLREEYYYNIRFRPNDPRLKPILLAPIPTEPAPQVVAWAVERADGGRGFGFTGGHFHTNWGVENVRRMALNAIVWAAGAEVPEGGVISTPPSPEDLAPMGQEAALRKAAAAARKGEKPIRALILTGCNGPFHPWRETTEALREAFARDPRFEVSVSEDPRVLAAPDLMNYDLLVQNYVNWERPSLGADAREGLLKFLRAGRGLALIHFAGGAWRDWPEYYGGIARRVWVDGKSGHDAYGLFQVRPTDLKHPIIQNFAPFETTDELYFNQQGDLHIEPLVTATSNVTGRDEPLAFAYEAEGGRVFQTLLGHDAASLRAPGEADLIRRGSAWAAGREVVGLRDSDSAPAQNSEGGAAPAGGSAEVHGATLDPRKTRVQVAPNDAWAKAPITVEVRAKLDSRAGFNILVAHAPKESSRHWELYTYAGGGAFSAYFPGFSPAEIVSPINVCDGRFHDLAMTWEPGRVSLYVDGKLVKAQDVMIHQGAEPAGPLFIGSIPTSGIGCDGLIDEVRISEGIREIAAGSTPFEPDDATLSLWRFDQPGDMHEDFGKLKLPAAPAAPGFNEEWMRKNLRQASPAAPPPVVGPTSSSPDQLDYATTDDRLAVRLIARSERESYVAVRPDSEGRLFVGGREALFLIEPTGDPTRNGGFGPARELYRFPADSWLTGIEFRGDDLYVMTASALYLFRGGRLARGEMKPERLVWGIPVDLHVSNHALAFGPEGDLYYTAGDPLLNYGDMANRPDHWGHWTIYHGGNSTPYTGQGGVFRVSPDGKRFEVIARGLRGTDGLCFDRYWNLFTNDNDHESIPNRYTPGRLLQVTRGVDFGWPRGWSPARSPERSDLVPLVYDGMGRAVPIGMAYYDESLMPDFRDNLLVARWCRMAITRYPLKDGMITRALPFSGGERRAEREETLLQGRGTARPVGVAVGACGRIFATMCYMAQNAGSPVYPGDVIVIAPKDAPAGSKDYQHYAPTTAPVMRLWEELASQDFARRRTAHQEIARRGGDLLKEAARRLKEAERKDPARESLERLAALASGVEGLSDRARAKALKLNYRDPNPRLTALEALAAESGELNPKLVGAILDAADAPEPRIRQTAAWVLSRRSPDAALMKIAKSRDLRKRLAATLALGMKLTIPDPTAPPPGVKLTYESPNAIFDIAYAGGEKIDIRKLGPVGSYTTAEWWLTVKDKSETQKLAQELARLLNDPDESVAVQAAFYLDQLGDGKFAEGIAAARERSALRRLESAPQKPIAAAWMIGPLADGPAGFDTPHEPEQGAITLDRSINDGAAARAWEKAGADSGAFGLPALDSGGGNVGSGASYYIYTRVQSASAQPAELRVGFDTGFAAWLNGAPVARNEGVRGAAPTVDAVRLELSPGSNDLLIRARSFGPPANLNLAIKALEPVAIEAPEKTTGLVGLADRLKAADIEKGEEPIAPEFLAVDWVAEVARGDKAKGKALFSAEGLGCAKCHSVSDEQAGAGAPSLAEAGRRFTLDHLVESVLRPSARIAEVFHATLIDTSDDTLTGLITGETATKIDMLLPDGTRSSMEKSLIKERRPLSLSPMPQGLVKSPEELRDLLAFLTAAE